MQTWRERIFKLRVERKITQHELARIIGVSERTMIRWENGETEPTRLKRAIVEALERESA